MTKESKTLIFDRHYDDVGLEILLRELDAVSDVIRITSSLAIYKGNYAKIYPVFGDDLYYNEFPVEILEHPTFYLYNANDLTFKETKNYHVITKKEFEKLKDTTITDFDLDGDVLSKDAEVEITKIVAENGYVNVNDLSKFEAYGKNPFYSDFGRAGVEELNFALSLPIKNLFVGELLHFSQILNSTEKIVGKG